MVSPDLGRKMYDENLIDFAGLRFSKGEIEAVTIKRDGYTIEITKDGDCSEPIGFACDGDRPE